MRSSLSLLPFPTYICQGNFAYHYFQALEEIPEIAGTCSYVCMYLFIAE